LSRAPLAAWLGLALALCLPGLARADSTCPVAWPLWQTFAEHFVQPDGRVMDASTPQRHSSSEGQSYAMFFALVANDPVTFERLWLWARNNLAAGDIQGHLPGWFWGLDAQGNWHLLDDNSASDADLWFAYDLIEAGRLWHRDDYTQVARQLLHNVATREVADLPGLGKMLMPGFRGFIKPDLDKPELWQLNPSYMPVPLLRRLAGFDPKGPWSEIATNTATLLKVVSYRGFVADWVSYRRTGPAKGEFIVDPVKGELGSYDAIRVYLWAGLTSPRDPLAKPILASLGGMLQATASYGTPPEKVQVKSGENSGSASFGFSAALLPYLGALDQPALQALQLRRVQTLMAQSLTADALKQAQPPYYHFVLSLFALGFTDHRYQLLENGKLQPVWEKTCRHAVTP
jgi:endoglucanase